MRRGGVEYETSPVSTARMLIITQFSLVRTLGRDSCIRTVSWVRDEAQNFHDPYPNPGL